MCRSQLDAFAVTVGLITVAEQIAAADGGPFIGFPVFCPADARGSGTESIGHSVPDPLAFARTPQPPLGQPWAQERGRELLLISSIKKGLPLFPSPGRPPREARGCGAPPPRPGRN